MAAKILVLNGSPRKNGNTAMVSQWVKEGAAPKAEVVETINVSTIHMAYNGCIGCRKCKADEDFYCFIADDASKIVKDMTNFDVIVFAVPVYLGSVPAQMKCLLDRMYSHIKFKNGEHITNPLLRHKVMALIATAGADYEGGLSSLVDFFQTFAEEFGGRMYQFTVPNCSPDLNDLKQRVEIMQAAKAFGQQLAGIEP